MRTRKSQIGGPLISKLLKEYFENEKVRKSVNRAAGVYDYYNEPQIFGRVLTGSAVTGGLTALLGVRCTVAGFALAGAAIYGDVALRD